MIDTRIIKQTFLDIISYKKMSRERHKSIWLVSHRDELVGRVENILRVVKINGFTEFNTDTDAS